MENMYTNEWLSEHKCIAYRVYSLLNDNDDFGCDYFLSIDSAWEDYDSLVSDFLEKHNVTKDMLEGPLYEYVDISAVIGFVFTPDECYDDDDELKEDLYESMSVYLSERQLFTGFDEFWDFHLQDKNDRIFVTLLDLSFRGADVELTSGGPVADLAFSHYDAVYSRAACDWLKE